MTRLALIARMDKTGLGNQTRALTEMLNPNKILVIDSSSFNKSQQYPDFYAKRNAYKNLGMLKPSDGIRFMNNVDVVFSCETFYSSTFINDARNRGVKTILQYNYEFLANLMPGTHALADKMVAPSLWRIEEARQKFGEVIYLPPPTNESKFEHVRKINAARTGKRKFLHIVGNRAAHDRNGTDDIIAALKYTNADFEIHIRTQYPLEIDTSDPRIVLNESNPVDETELYLDYDALISPRRYAGLCLPMNEALLSGLPVIMTNIDPNNKILPQKWLVDSYKIGEFEAKTTIEIYGSSLQNLANRIEWLCNADLSKEKQEAYEIGHTNFSFEVLKPKYEELINGVCNV